MTTLSDSSVFSLNSIAFFGREAPEYSRMFGLETTALRDMRVLDVAAGPSSFAARAAAAGVAVTAVDPLYGLHPEALAEHVRYDYARVIAEMRRKADLFPAGGAFASMDAAIASRQRAATEFLNDYEASFVHGRYVGGCLPNLPFADDSFDLVLCAHLLFIYPRQLDYAFHLQALNELLRVSRGEVRIHPLCGADGKPSPHLEPLLNALSVEGVQSRIISVGQGAFAGTDRTLVLRH